VVIPLADDEKKIETAQPLAQGKVVGKRPARWRRVVFAIWLLLTLIWLASWPWPWQFTTQTAAFRTHLYLIDGAFYWQHEMMHHTHAAQFVKFGLLADGHLVAPATRLLITTNGVGAGNSGLVGLHGLVYSWNPLAGSGLWLSSLVLGVIFLGPWAWWVAHRMGVRKLPSS